MDPRVTLNPKGGYRFLLGIEPYSSGVIAEPGFEIVHVTLATPLPWHVGLQWVRRYLEWIDLTQHALCGVELRCPEPHTMDGFIDFNRDYRTLLNEWDIPVDGENPVARTNVAPAESPPSETTLFGFSYAKPSETDATTFVIAGGGELPTRKLDEQRIVRLGEVTPEAMLEKARCVVDIMRTRLEGLGATDEQLTMIDVEKHTMPVTQMMTVVIHISRHVELNKNKKKKLILRKTILCSFCFFFSFSFP